MVDTVPSPPTHQPLKSGVEGAAGERAARDALENALRDMNGRGLNQGTSGNVSVRHGDTMLISPSATPYDTMRPEDVAAMPVEGEYGAWAGPLRPSTEWRFHLDILRARPDTGAVVHAHPTFCTALAMARKPIPAAHYMIAAFGGADVRCASYATFGTEALSRYAIEALHERNGCLLANHGMIVVGPSLAKAMWLAVELEALARQYWHSLQCGGPVLLTGAEVADAAQRFGSYGLRDGAAAPGRERRAS